MRSHAHSWRPFSQPNGHKRALTWSHADSSRRGGNPRSPRTSILGASPAWAPLLLLLPRWVSPGTCCLGASPRGPTPLSLLPRRRCRSALLPSETPLRPPQGPGNSQIGRYHPRGAPGEASSAPSPGGGVLRDSQLGEGEGGCG